MRKFNFLALNHLLVLWLLSIQIFAQQADLILTNGKIFTSDATQLYVHALAIKGNKIVAIGTNAKTKKINLKGKTVVPVSTMRMTILAGMHPLVKAIRIQK